MIYIVFFIGWACFDAYSFFTFVVLCGAIMMLTE